MPQCRVLAHRDLFSCPVSGLQSLSHWECWEKHGDSFNMWKRNCAKIAPSERKCTCVEHEAQDAHRCGTLQDYDATVPKKPRWTCPRAPAPSHSLTCISKHNSLNQRRLLIQCNPPNVESWIVIAHNGRHKHYAAKSLLTVCSKRKMFGVQRAQKGLFSFLIINKHQKSLQMMYDRQWNMNQTESLL